MNNRSITFREAETERLMRFARAGESAAIIGVSGIGKSNLFNHLLRQDVQDHYLAGEEIIFLRVNFHFAADFSSRSIFSLILEQFELLLEQSTRPWLSSEKLAEIEQYHDALLAAGNDPLIAQRYFKKAVRSLLTPNRTRKLIFLFDQFGDVYQTADERLFANLRGLREDYKYRIAYFVFLRQPLEQLAPPDRAREEFSELLASNQIGLGPYAEQDALEMIERVASRQHIALSSDQQSQLFQVTGGHSGLLRTATAALINDQITLSESVDKNTRLLLNLPQIQREGHKLWQSLSIEEQRHLSYVVHGETPQEDEPWIAQYLLTKGILQANGRGYEPFCPLLGRFIREQKAVWDQPLYYDRQARRVLLFGKPLETSLTPTELQIFLLLYNRLGEPVSNQEIKEAVWADDQADQPLKTNIYRLRRKIEPDSKHPRFLSTVPGFGYQLNDE